MVDYLRKLGYKVEENKKGVVVSNGDKKVLLTHQLLQSSNRAAIEIMVKDGLR